MNAPGAKPLTILFIIRYFHPYIGGMEKKTLGLASKLMQRGVPVEVVTSRFYGTWPQHELVKGVSVCRLPSPRIKIIGAFVFLISLFTYLLKNRSRIAIIQTFQVGYCSAVAILIGRILSKPTLLNLACSGRGGDIYRHTRTPWGRVFLLLCGYASRIVILNREMLQELQTISYNPHRVVYIPNGVDLTIYCESYERESLRKQLGITEEKVILYTGRLARQKGLEFLIHAFASLSVVIPVKLYIMGSGRELPRLKRLVKQYDAEHRIKILPAVEEVVTYLQIADIFVMPSLYEGLSNSILEAMACAVPVVATRVEGNVGLIEDGVTGVLVSRDHHQNLTAALTFLLEHPDKARELGLKAKQAVHEKYDLRIVAEQYQALYSTVTQKIAR